MVKKKVLKIMDKPIYLILQCGAPFIYKPAYFRVSNRLTPNSWNFICMQNKNNHGSIYLTKDISKDKLKNSVRFNGQGPIDYGKLSKRIKRSRLTNIPLRDLSSDINFLYY